MTGTSVNLAADTSTVAPPTVTTRYSPTSRKAYVRHCPNCDGSLASVRYDGRVLPGYYRCTSCECVWSIEEIRVLEGGEQ